MANKKVKPTKVHESFRADLLGLLNKHAGELDAIEMLAVASHAVGQILAMQDQRKVTPQQALEVMQVNIEQGNREVVDMVLKTEGSA